MNIETQYNYEKIWRETNEKELLKIIEEEIGDADPNGVLSYIKDAIKSEKIITVGLCKFRKKD